VNAELSWHSSPQRLVPPEHEVDVWRAGLDVTVSELRQLERTLSADERHRAERFRLGRHRDRFVAARGLLRDVLGRYLGSRPEHVSFSYGAYGKPALAPAVDHAPLAFNLAHSGAVALVAVTARGVVGVDLERVRAGVDCERIGAQFFSARENRTLRILPRLLRDEAFFTCWTRKEAYVKARGFGLALPLDTFDVSLAPGSTAKLLRAPGSSDEARGWWLLDCSPADGYVGAVAGHGPAAVLRRWQWNAKPT
jgi:4'-phosphopantetheinyl transferase